MKRRTLRAGFILSASLLLPALCAGQEIAKERVIGQLELVAKFDGPMPTGVTVANDGRIFVNFPRWGDTVDYTVAEVKDGKTFAYPNAEINRYAAGDQFDDKFVSVQSVVVDPSGEKLWVLDTGSIQFGPAKPGGPKLFGIDLRSNQIVKKIVFPGSIALSTSYLNDVRFDMHRGAAGTAFITDSSLSGANGIIVVDLASGESWRRLNDHPSTKADPAFVPIVEGEVLQMRLPGQPPAKFAVGSDGVAISPDGRILYYCPLTSRHLYSVSADALADRNVSDADVAATVIDLGEKGGGGDGLESDTQGRVYITDYEHNSITRRNLEGETETLVHDPRVLWPDTLSLASNGYLYFIVNQIERQGSFHNGQDLRKKPYALFRVKVDGFRIQN